MIVLGIELHADFTIGKSRPCSRAQSIGNFVAGIGMAHDAGAGIVPQHPLEPARGIVGAVGDDHHSGVLRIAHADAAAVVERHPGRAASRVEQGVEQRPVADGIAAVLHAFGLAVGRGDAAAVEMVAADDDRRRYFAAPHHLVEGEAETVALAETDPADARRQSLEGDALARHVEPAMEVRVVWDQLLHALVGAVNVLGIAAQRSPAERADPAAE